MPIQQQQESPFWGAVKNGESSFFNAKTSHVIQHSHENSTAVDQLSSVVKERLMEQRNRTAMRWPRHPGARWPSSRKEQSSVERASSLNKQGALIEREVATPGP